MARKQEWTVRVINYAEEKGRMYGNELPSIWIEQLRYMGLARELACYENPSRTVLEFYAPKGSDSKVWADQNAARMRSFGIDAAPAPKWSDEVMSSPFAATKEHMERLNRPRN